MDGGVVLRAPPKPIVPHLVFDLAAIRGAAFGQDKFRSGGPFISDAAKEHMEDAGITGVYFPREQT